MKQMRCLLCAALCVCCCMLPAMAEVPEEGMLCIDAEIFEGRTLTGICVTHLPEEEQGTLMLGSRRVQPGDVLTAQQAAQLMFVPSGEAEAAASVSYLPVFADGVMEEATTTFSIRGRENKPPVAEDAAFETYRNLELNGKLRVHDPEEQPMAFTVTREPRRGTVSIHEDGSFTYTPKKNKIGVDSFAFTAADPAGKVSRETTVTVTIMKPTDARQYTDTAGKSCRFAAEWMKNTGIFVGESIGEHPCFSPERPVTRGEFLAMLEKTLHYPTDEEIAETGYQDAPGWLKPYLAAAVRSGLIAALPARETFGAEEWITAEDAAALLCAALNLRAEEQSALASDTVMDAVAVAGEHDFRLLSGQILTRGETAELLYRAACLQEESKARF